MNIEKINSIEEIFERYQFYIIDIWGVLHNGSKDAYPFAIEALKSLKKNQKISIILSNSPRTQVDVANSLENKGIKKEMYDFLHTSGQEVENLLIENNYKIFESLGKKVFILGYSNLHEKAGHVEVKNLDEADYILATRVPQENLEFSIPLLNEAISKNIPLICANPDLVAQTFAGPSLCPGIIYDYYIEHGGQAIAIGKPNSEVYTRVLKKLNDEYKGFDPSKTLVIGDGLFTDILGANRQKLNSVLISSGIHDKLFDFDSLENEIARDVFYKLSNQESSLPNYICHSFK